MADEGSRTIKETASTNETLKESKTHGNPMEITYSKKQLQASLTIKLQEKNQKIMTK